MDEGVLLKQFAKPADGVVVEPITPGEPQIDPDAVRLQLERLIESPLFNQSKRYSRLLRYVVEETLDGRSARLKESTVGIDVFGRDPAYDTNVDPVCAQRQPNSGNQWIMRLDASLRYRYVRDREADISCISGPEGPEP